MTWRNKWIIYSLPFKTCFSLSLRHIRGSDCLARWLSTQLVAFLPVLPEGCINMMDDRLGRQTERILLFPSHVMIDFGHPEVLRTLFLQ